jgi:AcrR family transcriptional regulator
MAGQMAQAAGDSGRGAIIAAAADCFMEAGYDATSIDTVADRLGATKGRVYHYYRSKAELFYDVYRRGMAINLSTIEPIVKNDLAPREKLAVMCRAHVRNMLEHLSYQRVVMQGVEMHLAGSTTPAQREKLALLMKERERYEGLFRLVLVEGRDQGVFHFSNASFASKAVLAILNNPVLWYRRRRGDEKTAREEIVETFTGFALNSVAAGANSN